jgi:hypothetical protein
MCQGVSLTKSKYSNKTYELDNVKFASKLEAKRYEGLKYLMKAHYIKDLTLQPSFVICEGFSLKGKKYRAAHYIADFLYFHCGKDIWVVEDVKGFKTDIYKLKKKIFLRERLTTDGTQLQFNAYDLYPCSLFLFEETA